MGNADIEKKHQHRALGIDPGLAATGYAVLGTLQRKGELCAWGAIKTMAQQSTPQRLKRIYEAVSGLIEQWRPDILVLEDVYVFNVFPKAAIQLGEVRGVIYLAAQDNNIAVMKIKPTEVKSCLTGNGRATKSQVKNSVSRILGMHEELKPDHASDAAALALMALSRAGYFQW